MNYFNKQIYFLNKKKLHQFERFAAFSMAYFIVNIL